MKQWVKKLIEQLEYDLGSGSTKSKPRTKLSDDRATLLYFLDVYNKHLIEIDTHPVRRVREELDEFTRELVNPDKGDVEKVLFKLRQFFSSYRVAEYTYIRKTFEDFKGIIWNFVEQLSEDFQNEQAADREINQSLEQLKEAVESESIDLLRAKSREFIDFYIEHQTKRESRRSKRMKGIKKNLDMMKKQLVEADRSLKLDHLTQAHNRRSFDEHIKQQANLCRISSTPVTLVLADIDHFKKINDTYGHDIGDFILKECVRMFKESFNRETDFVARVGGEEFALVLSETAIPLCIKRIEDLLARIRKEVFVTEGTELRFTVSMGIAQIHPNESVESWYKRADQALYQSKHSGRNRYTVAEPLQNAA